MLMKPKKKAMKNLKSWLEKMEKNYDDDVSKSTIEMLKKYEYKCVICRKVFTFEEVKEHILEHGDSFELVSPNPSARK